MQLSAHPSLSIIVPVLNEANILDRFLSGLHRAAPAAEIIVVDGGSDDASVVIAERNANVVLHAHRGRAAQMNAGAACARAEVLWFLHADLSVPADAVQEINEALMNAGIVGGCFRLRFPRRELIYRVSDRLGNIGVDVFGFALGDHGIFCRRVTFEKVGGYPDVPILEDAELYRKLSRPGRMIQLVPQIVCSPRAYERFGRYRTTAVYFIILVLYVCGVPIRHLYRIYQAFRNRTNMPRATAAAATH
jgi:rSAM/selenodomain-associated transferase 2